MMASEEGLGTTGFVCLLVSSMFRFDIMWVEGGQESSFVFGIPDTLLR
jgi:hypothetical protein